MHSATGPLSHDVQGTEVHDPLSKDKEDEILLKDYTMNQEYKKFSFRF